VLLANHLLFSVFIGQATKVLPPLIMELLAEKLNKKAMESITKMEDLHR
jgi:hypothetical protein